MERRPTNGLRANPESWLVALLLVGAFFLSKLSVLELPYHWDEAGAYVSPALWLAEAGLHRVLPGLHPPARFYGHPPGIHFALATLYRLLGHGIWLTHVVAVAVGAATFYLTFRLGHRIGGTASGALAALLLLLDPLFFAQAGLMHGDMVVAALGLGAVLFYLQERWWAYFAAAVALLACKETGLGIVAGIVAYHVLFRRDRPERAREALWLGAPSLVLIAFFATTWATSGRLVNNPYFVEHALADPSFARLRRAGRWLLLDQGRWILTLATLTAFLAVPRTFRRRELGLLTLLVLPYACAFGVLYALPRYLLPAFPFLCIAAALALVALGRRWKVVPLAAVAFVAAVFATELTGVSDHPGSHEVDLEYVDVVETHFAAAAWLESHRADARIRAAWPLSLFLRDPALGYVTRPLDVVAEDRDVEILAWTAQGAPENRDLLERARAERWRVLERFEQGGKVAALFERPDATRVSPAADSG